MKESLIGHIAQLTRDQKIELAAHALSGAISTRYQLYKLGNAIMVYADNENPQVPEIDYEQRALDKRKTIIDLIFPQPYQDSEKSDLTEEEQLRVTLAYIRSNGQDLPQDLREVYLQLRDIEKEHINNHSGITDSYTKMMDDVKIHVLKQLKTLKKP